MSKDRFLRLINSRWRMGLFLWWKLPSAAFMGIRLLHCDGQEAVIRLPYRWTSQNPFRSTYFAAQCAAAELSTGVLGLAALQGKPPVSMLVLGIEATFVKKAAEPLLFTCTEGEAVERAVLEALSSGEPRTIQMTSVGRLPDQTEAARVRITWSFKAKQS